MSPGRFLSSVAEQVSEAEWQVGTARCYLRAAAGLVEGAGRLVAGLPAGQLDGVPAVVERVDAALECLRRGDLPEPAGEPDRADGVLF